MAASDGEVEIGHDLERLGNGFDLHSLAWEVRDVDACAERLVIISANFQRVAAQRGECAPARPGPSETEVANLVGEFAWGFAPGSA